ncbi:TetR/AcrR family transcriptional regulator [Bacillus sp. HMF5848]|uniref:TetR/AcrR family transcriptional regulator n=1 Tax=Bacillus sp. HMF5848 TaxID=2495421 RepID=UPI000F780B06|nr:TetR/AcrR family transcriptional regulator [Bacillus sp. HMF5848]RSK25997.1 TetR/AcrR family transcriptional regulator [Bacillus sp. HMF5848]
MLNSKKEQIVQAAMKLFAENGYHATSMQELATYLDMAKGTLYNKFSSKEELLLHILDHYQTEMFDKVRLIAQDQSIAPKDRLAKQVAVQFHEFKRNKNFIKMQMKEQLNKSEAVQKQMFTMRARVLKWQKETLLTVYGDAIQPYIWDVVTLFNGMIKEYMMLLVVEEREFSTENAAQFIVNRIDGIICDILENKPEAVLNHSLMSYVEQLVVDQEEICLIEKIAIEVKELAAVIDKQSDAGQLKEALDALQAELLHEEKSNNFLADACLALLEKKLGKDAIAKIQILSQIRQSKQIKGSL